MFNLPALSQRFAPRTFRSALFVAVSPICVACGTMPQTSFVPPAAAVPYTGTATVSTSTNQPAPTTIEQARSRALQRRQEYAAAADAVMTFPQYMDFLTYGAGFTGLGAITFQNNQSLAKRAAFAATLLLTGRSYLDSDARHGVLLSGAAADSCLANTADSLSGLTNLDDWSAVYNAAFGEPEASQLAQDMIRLGSIAIDAPRKIWGSQVRVDDAVRHKFKSPATPNVAGLMAAYEANIAKAADDKTKNNLTANMLSAPINLEGLQNALRAPAGRQTFTVRASLLLSNHKLNDALSGLDAELVKCEALSS